MYSAVHCAKMHLDVLLQEMDGKEVDGQFLGVKMDSYA